MKTSVQPTIFVAIASYNDEMLPHTLDSCLSNARHPENLRFGICWQADRNEPVDIDRFKTDERFRFSEYTTDESEGGSWARNIAQQHWQGETYTMQVDSHMVFAPGWDSDLVRMMHKFPSDKPLISMITPLFSWRDGKDFRHTAKGLRVTAVRDWKEGGGWAPWFDWGHAVKGEIVRNRFLSGGFVFTLGKWNEEVRQDPQHYYWGEEFALSLRSYTHGYDIFLPDAQVLWHIELAEPPRRHWEHGTEVVQRKNAIAIERLHQLAFHEGGNAEQSLGRYGLGTERSLHDFERFSGMDLASKKAHSNVFEGYPPDPNTINSDADWADCLTLSDYNEMQIDR